MASLQSNQALERILSVLTAEQLALLADSLVRAHGRSVERRCIQSVEVVFSEKGYPRHIHVSDSVFMSSPKYQAE